MQCPKCGHQQEETVKCNACGIYFDKFLQQQAKQREPRINAPEQGGHFPIKTFLIVAAITGMAIYWHSSRNGTVPVATSNVTLQTASSVVGKDDGVIGMVQQLAQSHPARNPIEAARNATVFIKTEWGSLGSGFIIDAQCDVVTNRHVVEMDPDKVSQALQERPDFRVKLAEAKIKMELGIKQLKAAYSQLLAREGNTYRVQELRAKISTMETELAELPEKVNRELTNKISDVAWSANNKGFTVTLIDGTEFPATRAEYASRADLAWFRLPAGGCPYVRSADSSGLQQGQKLYTVGSPAGLTYTVTSGVFSGYRDIGQQQFLQTDAPINPGNSGGPLINERGEVVGINSMVLRDNRGIGFAIPIEKVYEEFSLLRP